MASPSLKAIVLAAACAAAGCASSPAPLVPERHADTSSYREARERLVRVERARRLGAALVLSADEEAADRRLRDLREAELERVGSYFPPAHSYLLDRTKRAIEQSPVLRVMKRLPKGAVLHVHGSAGGDLRWLVESATRRPDCFVFVGAEGPIVRGTLRLFKGPPEDGWRPVAALRNAAPDPAAFDEDLYRSITLGEEDHEAPDLWPEFSNCFRRAFGLFDDAEVRAEHWRRMLADFVDHNVQRVEFRGWPVDDAVLREARRRDPDFTVGFIPAAGRSNDPGKMRGALERALAERERDPGGVAGFDLVEEEDRTHPTLSFVPEILAARGEAERGGLSLPLFLHSGETRRRESGNLYDAVLLGARRIGHGLALVRHPLLMEIARERGVAIEACPISNQVLGYVPDLRTHPAIAYINAGIPVVLAPDDPGVMRHTISHDFYEAFMAWELDLRDLKQLALSSLHHSTLGAEERRHAVAVWEGRWEEFVRWLNEDG